MQPITFGRSASANCLAIIPARGGSKGIPRKNIRLLAGKPLIGYNIEQAKASKFINRVIVSTDDPEIAAISQQFGAEVIWRPVEISGDSASSELALLHTLETLQKNEGYQPEILVFLQCTSPLTLAEDIDGTIQALIDNEADTALAVIPFHYFLWRNTEASNAEGINHDKRYRPLRQEREPQYLETGAVYVMRTSGFLQAQHRFFGKTSLYVMPAERRLEIDDPVDFQVAEVLLNAKKQADAIRELPDPVEALVLDFDGVFTDNRVIVHQDGSEAVLANRSDGWGLGQLKKTGLPILILSTEINPVVQARARKLNLPCLNGLQDKAAALKEWLADKKIDPAHVVYLGNDINDLDCIKMVGCPVAVADAHPSILPYVNFVLDNLGGHGAIRELCELILSQLVS